MTTIRHLTEQQAHQQQAAGAAVETAAGEAREYEALQKKAAGSR